MTSILSSLPPSLPFLFSFLSIFTGSQLLPEHAAVVVLEKNLVLMVKTVSLVPCVGFPLLIMMSSRKGLFLCTSHERDFPLSHCS